MHLIFEGGDLNRLLQTCIGKNRQSPYHVFVSHRDMFNCSLRTLYNYINLGILNVKPIDLPRATRRKPRKTKSRTHKVDARCREGRSYTDYLSYMEKHPRVFYCDPNRSDQKGACENDHINFRRVVPKGTDMDGFDQELIDRIFSQINNFCRFSLNGKTPFAMFRFLYGDVPLKAWNIQYVEPDDVVLSPSLVADHRLKGEDHHDDAHDKK